MKKTKSKFQPRLKKAEKPKEKTEEEKDVTNTKIRNDGRLLPALNPIRQMKTGTLSLVCVSYFRRCVRVEVDVLGCPS